MGEWAWAAGIAPLLGPWRLGAVQCVLQRQGGFDPHQQLDFLSRHEVTNVFTTPTAMRSMMAIEDAGTRYPQKFRRVCSAGEPLNPEAIRWFREQYGLTVLDYYGLTESYPLCANFPFMEVREGSMGRPMPGWDVQILDEDEQPVAQGERGEICLRARSNPHWPLGYWNNEEAARETFGGEWFHTKDAATMDEDGYVWYAGRADDVIISAGYRIGPFEVESACLEHPAVREAAAVASPDEVKGHVVKAFIVLADGHERLRRARARDPDPRARAAVGLRLPTQDRVRHRPAQDPDRQDPPHRVARAGVRSGRARLAFRRSVREDAAMRFVKRGSIVAGVAALGMVLAAAPAGAVTIVLGPPSLATGFTNVSHNCALLGAPSDVTCTPEFTNLVSADSSTVLVVPTDGVVTTWSMVGALTEHSPSTATATLDIARAGSRCNPPSPSTPRTRRTSVRVPSCQSARSQIPGSRSIQRPCVSAMSSAPGVNTSKTKRPSGARRASTAWSAARRSESLSMCRSERNGIATSANGPSTGGWRMSPWRRSTSPDTPASSARSRATASMPSELSTPITETPAEAIGTAMRPVPTPSSSTGPPARTASST